MGYSGVATYTLWCPTKQKKLLLPKNESRLSVVTHLIRLLLFVNDSMDGVEDNVKDPDSEGRGVIVMFAVRILAQEQNLRGTTIKCWKTVKGPY